MALMARTTPTGLRLSGLTLCVGLVLAGCGSSTDAPEGSEGAADPGSSASSSGPAPVDAADLEPVAAWLADEVGRNGFVEGSYVDHGLSLDFAVTLDDLGGHDDVVERILDAMQDPREVEGYVSFYDEDKNGQYAGATAKLVHTVVEADRDVTDYRGDLVADLTAMVVESGPEAGRAEDTGAEDYSNAISQSFVVRALAATDEEELLAPTVEFLLAQQCEPGWFRESLAAGPDGQHTCDEAARGDRQPSVDATAHAVQALLEVRDQLGGDLQDSADSAVEAAVAWTEEVQGAEGGYSVTGDADDPTNANSTGLAVKALAAAGRDDVAAAGAEWLLARRLDSEGRLSEEAGAVAFSDDALAKARRRGLTEGDRPQWQRATVEAAGGLHAVTRG